MKKSWIYFANIFIICILFGGCTPKSQNYDTHSTVYPIETDNVEIPLTVTSPETYTIPPSDTESIVQSETTEESIVESTIDTVPIETEEISHPTAETPSEATAPPTTVPESEPQEEVPEDTTPSDFIPGENETPGDSL